MPLPATCVVAPATTRLFGRFRQPLKTCARTRPRQRRKGHRGLLWLTITVTQNANLKSSVIDLSAPTVRMISVDKELDVEKIMEFLNDLTRECSAAAVS